MLNFGVNRCNSSSTVGMGNNMQEICHVISSVHECTPIKEILNKRNVGKLHKVQNFPIVNRWYLQFGRKQRKQQEQQQRIERRYSPLHPCLREEKGCKTMPVRRKNRLFLKRYFIRKGKHSPSKVHHVYLPIMKHTFLYKSFGTFACCYCKDN